MKKTILLVFSIVLLSSCLKNDLPNYGYEFLAIDEATTPASFTFGKKDTISIKYTLPSSCYSFDNIYYEYQDTTRIVAIRALNNLDISCTQATIAQEYKLIVNVAQQEDYVFKFFKGTDNDGKNIFEEVIVPVN